MFPLEVFFLKLSLDRPEPIVDINLAASLLLDLILLSLWVLVGILDS